MGECWYCYWGWPSQVAEIYDRWLDVAGERAMQYGPAHIVWSEENFEREHVQWCLDHFQEYTGYHAEEELAAVRRSLEELLALPDDVLSPEPDAYDGEDPEAFHPPNDLVMRHV